MFILCFNLFFVFFFSSRRRHTRCALVTGVQTCALPICTNGTNRPALAHSAVDLADCPAHDKGWALDRAKHQERPEMLILYSHLVTDDHLSPDQDRKSTRLNYSH